MTGDIDPTVALFIAGGFLVSAIIFGLLIWWKRRAP